METFIGHEDELNTLGILNTTDKSDFVVVLGRHCVGKTQMMDIHM